MDNIGGLLSKLEGARSILNGHKFSILYLAKTFLKENDECSVAYMR